MPDSAPCLSEVQLLELLDEFSAAAYTCNPQGLITSFNARAVELWGRAPKTYDPADAYCGSYKLFSTDGAPIAHNQCWMARALHENKAFNGMEIVIERPDGKRLTALAHANPIRDHAGRLLGAVNVLVDASPPTQVDASPQPQGAPNEWLAILAHELRHPLAPIQHMVDYLKKTPEVGASQVEQATNIISAQVKQLTHLIDDLLDLGSIARGAYKIRKTPIDLGAAIQAAAEALRPMIEARGHELKLTLPSAPVIVRADPVRIGQIVTNLLDNANRHTKQAGHISVEVRSAGGFAVVGVRDSGTGIPRALLPHVFEPFTRAKRSRLYHRGGLGLGLSITKALVELHGGEVSVMSSARGSTFTVRLPVARVASARAPALPSVSRPLPSHRILIVDDHAAAADSLAILLDAMGQDVSVVLDGASAISTARTLKPRIVFIDIEMPGMDGYQVAQRLRREHSPAHMLLVAATGYGQEERSPHAKFDHYLTKPIGIDDLEAIFSSLELPANGRSRV
ncbi:MAG: ATP-binding protein [Gammaproteobacteria bacterium]